MKTSIIIFAIVFLAGMCLSANGAIIWAEDFESYVLGDLPSQDSNWTQYADAGLTEYSGQIVSGQQLRLTASAPIYGGQIRNTVYRDFGDMGIVETQVTIKFSMNHTLIAMLYHGKVSGMSVISSTKGRMIDLTLFDTSEGASINGHSFSFPSQGTHSYQLDIDFDDDTVVLTVDSSVYGPFSLLGTTDWSAADMVSTTDRSGLAWFSGLYYTNSPRSNMLYVDDIIVSQGVEMPAEIPDIVGGEVYSLVPGRNFFNTPNDHIVWGSGPVILLEDSWIAVTDLNRTTPLTVTVEHSGYLYALLWRWDFGVLSDDYADVSPLHGWTLVDESVGTVVNFPEPLASPALYRRPLSAGTHDIYVTEYFGQWVLAGYVTDGAAVGDANFPSAQVVGGVTMDNVVDPCEWVTVTSDDAIIEIHLCSRGGTPIMLGGTTFNAPTEPGRYWLAVEFSEGIYYLPLTVGFGPVAEPGWHVDEFFPDPFLWQCGIFI